MNGLRMDELSAEVEVLESCVLAVPPPPNASSFASKQEAETHGRTNGKNLIIAREAVGQCATGRGRCEAYIQQNSDLDGAVK